MIDKYCHFTLSQHESLTYAVTYTVTYTVNAVLGDEGTCQS